VHAVGMLPLADDRLNSHLASAIPGSGEYIRRTSRRSACRWQPTSWRGAPTSPGKSGVGRPHPIAPRARLSRPDDPEVKPTIVAPDGPIPPAYRNRGKQKRATGRHGRRAQRRTAASLITRRVAEGHRARPPASRKTGQQADDTAAIAPGDEPV